MDSSWTLEELEARVAEAIAAQGLAPESGRVRAAPDARTIRYYTTLGLLDRPLGVKDRRKLYGERHRQQLVAIKRLQSEGKTLDEVQATLLGLSPQGLADLAHAAAPAAAPRATMTGAFWKVRPAGPTSGVPATAAPPTVASATVASATVASATVTTATVVRVSGATLLLDEELPGPLSDDDRRALAEAAAPLLRQLEALRARSVSRPPSEER